MILSQDVALTGLRSGLAGESEGSGRTWSGPGGARPPGDGYRTNASAADTLVGRGAELAAVVDAVSAAGRGTGRVLTIEGPAGMGKPAVLSRVHNAVDAAGGHAARSRRCAPG